MKSEELIRIIKIVKCMVDSPNTNLTWSRYNNITELLQELDLYTEKIIRNDASVINDLKILIAPTGSLQEISIDNGWGDDFIEISSRLDKLF